MPVRHLKAYPSLLLLWITLLIMLAQCGRDTDLAQRSDEREHELAAVANETATDDEPQVSATSSPQQSDVPGEDNGLDPATKLFFTLFDDEEQTVGIWQTRLDGTEQWQLLALPGRYPLASLPAHELAILEHEYCVDENDPCPSELDYGFGGLTLFAQGQLAWVDDVEWCPSTWCYGFQRIASWYPSKEGITWLLEMPFHVDLKATQGIRDMAWSPRGDEIGYVVTSHEYGWSSVNVLDVATHHVRSLGEGRSPIAWSPNGERIAMAVHPADWGVSVIGARDGSVVNTFGGNWGAIMDLDWSPDSASLVVVAQGTDDASRFKMRLVSLDRADVTDIILNEQEIIRYAQTRWSPREPLLGSIIEDPDLDKELIIFDPQQGQILASRKDITAWSWSDDGDSILVGVRGSSGFTEGIGIFYWREDRLEMIPLLPKLEEDLKERKRFLGNLTW